MWYEEECPAEAECSVCSPAESVVRASDPSARQENNSGFGNANCNNTTVVASIPQPLPSCANSKYVDVPHNFYWAIPNKLIGMGCPLRRKHIENLYHHHKVAMIVNLRECGTPQQFFEGTTVQNVHIPIKSFGTPSMRQVRQFVRYLDQLLDGESEGEESDEEYTEGYRENEEINERTDGRNGNQATNIDAGRCNDCDFGAANANACVEDGADAKDKRKRSSLGILCKKEESGEQGIRKKVKKNNKEGVPGPTEIPSGAVAVNCRWGKGRTGTMICCYLVHKEGITAHEAICRVRKLSAESVETRGQEEFVEEFYRLKLVKEGREGQYQRSLPYAFTPQQQQRTVIVSRTYPAATVNTSPAASPVAHSRAKKGVSYGRHEPAAVSRAYAKVATGNSKKICWNNSLLVANMYK